MSGDGSAREANAESLLACNGIRKRYKGRDVLRGIALDVRSGELTAIVGANGSGKSTLLRIMAGLTVPEAGTVRLSAASSRRGAAGSERTGKGAIRIGYAPDRLPKLKFAAREYLHYMAAIAGLPRQRAEAAISRHLAYFGFGEEADKLQLRHYSKGMLQKINLIQAVLAEPELLLLDEPFGGLDEAHREAVTALLRELRARGTAIVAASHDSGWVERLADRRIALAAGRIVADERPARRAEGARRHAQGQELEEAKALPPQLPRAVVRVRDIVARIPPGPEAEKELRALEVREGFVGSERVGEGVVRYRVEAAGSDGWLLALLAAGASIRELSAERTEEMP